MFIGVTFVAADKKGEIREIRAIVDTKYIRMIVEDKDHKDRCMITFNDENASYLPFSDTLMVSYNGCECYRDLQFEEMGEYGVLSNKVKMLFPLREGDQLLFRVVNHN